MTPLSREVRRRSNGHGVNRCQFVVTLSPGDVITFRDLRRRQSYTVTLAQCYALAVRQHVMSQPKRKRRS